MNGLITQGDKGVKQKLQMSANAKLKAFNDGLTLVEPYAPVNTTKEKEEFFNGMIAYVVKRLRNKARDFEQMLSDERILEFFDVPVHMIKEIQARVKADSQLTFNKDFTAVTIPDLSVYATTPQEEERLKASQEFIQAVERLHSFGYTIHYGQLSQAVSYAVHASGTSLKHNPQFIRKK